MKTDRIAICTLALALLASPLPLFASAESDCKTMAAEDEVPPEDMDDYMAECLAAASAEEADEQGSGGEQEAPSGR